jgi:hypothetical protein
MPYSIRLPDGTLVENIPDELNPSEAKRRIVAAYPQFAPETTVGGQVKEAFKGLIPGAVGLLETTGAGAAALLPEEYETPTREKIKELATAAKKPFEAAPGYEETVGRKLGESVGSVIPFLALGKLRGMVGAAGALGLGVGAGAGEARTRAEAEGATAEQRAAATGFGIIPGAAEAFAPLRILGRLSDDIVGGGVAYVKRALAAGGEEAAQEAASGFAQNLIAKGIYKPEQELIEGLGEQAAYGGATGAIVQGLLDLAIGRRARGPAAPTTPAEAAVTPPVAPVNAFEMTPVDRAREMASLMSGEQTPDIQARIEELRAADIQQVEQDLARIKGTEPTTLEEQIKTQAPTQMAIREAGIEDTGFIPGGEFAGPVPEAQFPTILTADVLDQTGLSKRSSFYKELEGKDLTDPEDQVAVGQILNRVRANPNLSESTKSGVESVALQGFGAAAKQQDLFVTKGKKKGEPTPGALRTGAVEEEVAEEAIPVAEGRPITEQDFKDMGIASSNKELREKILGKDLTDPEQAATVKEALDAFGSDPKRSPKVAQGVEDFLNKMGFRGEQDVGVDREIIPGTDESGVPSAGIPGGELAPAGAAEPTITEGVEDNIPDAGPLAAGERPEQRPLRQQTIDEANAAFGEYVKNTGSINAAVDRMAGEIAFETKLNRVNKAAQKALSPELQERLKDKVKQYRFKAKQGEKAAQRYLKYRTAPKGTKGNSRDMVERQVRKLMAGWANAPKTEVVQSITELPDYMQNEIRDAKVNPKGAFDPRTETVYLVADNLVGYNDITITVAHEAIGHYGLRSVLGGTYSKVLNDLYRTNDQVRAKADIKIKQKLDKDTAIEEVLAEAIEEKVPADTMMGKAVQQLKNILRRVMRAFGVSTLNDRDVQDLLNSFSDYVVEGKGTRGEGVAGPKTGIFRGEEVTPRNTESKEFKNWFGNSKVVDAEGKPLMAYHGTPYFEGYEFKPFESKNRAGNIDGYYFTTSTQDANDYAGTEEGAEVIPTFLSIKNPYVPRKSKVTKAMREQYFKEMIGANKHLSDERAKEYAESKMYYLDSTGMPLINAIGNDGAAFQRIIKAGGYDGYQDGIGSRHWVAFEPNQIKSAIGNIGTYSPTSSNILFRRGAAPTLTAEGQRAQQTVDRLKGISNEKPKVPERSTVEKVGAFFFDPSYRQDQIDRVRVRVAYKGASIERKLMDAFNGKVRDALGNIRPDLFMTAAEHSDTMTVAAMKQGTLFLNKNIGWDVKKGPNSLEGAMNTVRKLGEKLGSQDLAFKLANDAFIARRANALKNHPEKDVFNLPSQDKIDAGLKAFKDFPELETAFKEYTGFKNGLIDAMVEGGRLSPEQAKTWKDAIDYVPWNRIKEYEETAQTGPKGHFKGLTNLGQMGKLTGSENEINNVFDNMVGLSFWMTNSAIRNHAALNLVDTFSRLNLGIRRVQEGQSGVDDNRKIYIYRDGKPESYELDSIADVYAFKGVESVSMPMLKSLASFANFLRKATTATPQFAVSQLFQDSYRATVMSGTKNPFRTAAGVLAGFKDAYFKDPTTQRLEQLGITGMVDLMPGRVKDEIEKEFGLKQRSTMERALNFMESFSIASDAALRKSVFERTLAETKSEQFPEGDMLLARYRAQEIINFKRQGASGMVGMFRQVIPFMNAYIQGMDVFYRSMTGRGIAADERAAATRLFWATGAKLATLSLVYAMMVGDDEEYEGLRDFEKDKNFIVPGVGIKIPVAPEVGFLFKVLPERAYNYITSQGTATPQDATALRKALFTAGVDAITGPNLTPQFIKPLIEVNLNQSFFTNTPVVGRGLDQRESSQQFTSNTAELAKMFGELTGVSPMKLEYMFRGYTGIAGGTLLDLTNMMFTNRPDRHVYEMPGFKTFMYDKIPGGYKEQYYDLRDKVTEVNATINGMIADGREDELMPYLTDEKLNKYALVQTINEIDQQMEDFRALRKLVAGDKSMGGEEKRRVIDDIDRTENELLKFYNVPAMRKNIAGL